MATSFLLFIVGLTVATIWFYHNRIILLFDIMTT